MTPRRAGPSVVRLSGARRSRRDSQHGTDRSKAIRDARVYLDRVLVVLHARFRPGHRAAVRANERRVLLLLP